MRRIGVVFGVLAWALAARCLALSLQLNADVWTVQVGQTTTVQVFLDADPSQSVNAFDLTVQYPIDTVQLKSWNNGESIVGLWVDQPTDDRNGNIHLSGVMPGGYEDPNGRIVTFVFQGIQQGLGELRIAPSTRLYLNDGKGTEAAFSTKPFKFRVVNAGDTSPLPTPRVVFRDVDAPESFTISIASDSSMFGGKWFAVFSTQDKGSGVDHYEIWESKFPANTFISGNWQRAESPYVLRDQGRQSYVYVRAFDHAGNMQIAHEDPLVHAWYANWWIWSILIVSVCVIFGAYMVFHG